MPLDELVVPREKKIQGQHAPPRKVKPLHISSVAETGTFSMLRRMSATEHDVCFQLSEAVRLNTYTTCLSLQR